MIPDEIDNLEAGPELDTLIAERVMGWVVGPEEYVHGHNMHVGSFERSWVGSKCDGRTWLVGGFKPSTDIAAAWQVVEKLKGNPGDDLKDWHWNPEIVWLDDNRGWAVVFNEQEASAPTAPLAICRAALRAISNG